MNPSRACLPGVVVLAAALVAPACQAAAGPDDEIYSPRVEAGEAELEVRAYRLDGNGEHENKATEYRFAIGYSPTTFWRASVEPVLVDGPNSSARFDQVQFENVFQLTPENRYGIDLGLLAAYDLALRGRDNDELEFGPILEKRFDAFVINAQLFGEREVTSGGGYGLNYGWQLKWNASPRIALGVQGFGERELSGDEEETGNPENAPLDTADGPTYSEGDRIGPALFGTIPIGDDGLNYQLGVLFGISHGAADHTFRLAVEYEL